MGICIQQQRHLRSKTSTKTELHNDNTYEYRSNSSFDKKKQREKYKRKDAQVADWKGRERILGKRQRIGRGGWEGSVREEKVRVKEERERRRTVEKKREKKN